MEDKRNPDSKVPAIPKSAREAAQRELHSALRVHKRRRLLGQILRPLGPSSRLLQISAIWSVTLLGIAIVGYHLGALPDWIKSSESSVSNTMWQVEAGIVGIGFSLLIIVIQVRRPQEILATYSTIILYRETSLRGGLAFGLVGTIAMGVFIVLWGKHLTPLVPILGLLLPTSAILAYAFIRIAYLAVHPAKLQSASAAYVAEKLVANLEEGAVLSKSNDIILEALKHLHIEYDPLARRQISRQHYPVLAPHSGVVKDFRVQQAYDILQSLDRSRHSTTIRDSWRDQQTALTRNEHKLVARCGDLVREGDTLFLLEASDEAGERIVRRLQACFEIKEAATRIRDYSNLKPELNSIREQVVLAIEEKRHTGVEQGFDLYTGLIERLLIEAEALNLYASSSRARSSALPDVYFMEQWRWLREDVRLFIDRVILSGRADLMSLSRLLTYNLAASAFDRGDHAGFGGMLRLSNYAAHRARRALDEEWPEYRESHLLLLGLFGSSSRKSMHEDEETSKRFAYNLFKSLSDFAKESIDEGSVADVEASLNRAEECGDQTSRQVDETGMAQSSLLYGLVVIGLLAYVLLRFSRGLTDLKIHAELLRQLDSHLSPVSLEMLDSINNNVDRVLEWHLWESALDKPPGRSSHRGLVEFDSYVDQALGYVILVKGIDEIQLNAIDDTSTADLHHRVEQIKSQLGRLKHLEIPRLKSDSMSDRLDAVNTQLESLLHEITLRQEAYIVEASIDDEARRMFAEAVYETWSTESLVAKVAELGTPEALSVASDLDMSTIRPGLFTRDALELKSNFVRAGRRSSEADWWVKYIGEGLASDMARGEIEVLLNAVLHYAQERNGELRQWTVPRSRFAEELGRSIQLLDSESSAKHDSQAVQVFVANSQEMMRIVSEVARKEHWDRIEGRSVAWSYWESGPRFCLVARLAELLKIVWNPMVVLNESDVLTPEGRVRVQIEDLGEARARELVTEDRWLLVETLLRPGEVEISEDEMVWRLQQHVSVKAAETFSIYRGNLRAGVILLLGEEEE